MATTPDQDVVTYLDANVGSLTENTNLFIGKMVAAGEFVPHNSVFVLASGGQGRQAYVGSVNSVERNYSAIQVIIRSDERDFPAGQTLARTVRDAIHHAGVSGYIDVRAMETEPLYISEDDEGHHIWSVNLELWHEE